MTSKATMVFRCDDRTEFTREVSTEGDLWDADAIRVDGRLFRYQTMNKGRFCFVEIVKIVELQ